MELLVPPLEPPPPPIICDLPEPFTFLHPFAFSYLVLVSRHFRQVLTFFGDSVSVLKERVAGGGPQRFHAGAQLPGAIGSWGFSSRANRVETAVEC